MTPEQSDLLEKAKRSIRGARVLVDEGLYGFAAGRAYYAMFYVAQAFLLGEGLRFSKHSATIAAFGKHFVKTGLLPQAFYADLRRAQDDRLSGDYDTAELITEDTAAKDIQRAEAFLDLAYEKLSEKLY